MKHLPPADAGGRPRGGTYIKSNTLTISKRITAIRGHPCLNLPKEWNIQPGELVTVKVTGPGIGEYYCTKRVSGAYKFGGVWLESAWGLTKDELYTFEVTTHRNEEPESGPDDDAGREDQSRYQEVSRRYRGVLVDDQRGRAFQAGRPGYGGVLPRDVHRHRSQDTYGRAVGDPETPGETDYRRRRDIHTRQVGGRRERGHGGVERWTNPRTR